MRPTGRASGRFVVQARTSGISVIAVPTAMPVAMWKLAWATAASVVEDGPLANRSGGAGIGRPLGARQLAPGDGHEEGADEDEDDRVPDVVDLVGVDPAV